jgi:hypothetical protein
MATTTVEFDAPTGLTLTVDHYPLGNDTATATGVATTEAANRKGTYSFTYAGAVVGVFEIHVKVGSAFMGVLYCKRRNVAETIRTSDYIDVLAWENDVPNDLQSGRVDAYLGAVAAGVIAAASFASGALDAVWSTGTRTLTSFGTLVADIWTQFSATQLAKFFTVNSGSTYGAAVAGSVVKEIADNAGGGGGAAVAFLIGGWTKSGSTYHVSYGLNVSGALVTSGLSALSVTFRDEDGTDLVFSGTPAAGTGGIVNASGTLGTAITPNTPVMVVVAATYNSVPYSFPLPGASIS